MSNWVSTPSACQPYLPRILDKPDRKQLKKLGRLQEMSQSHVRSFCPSSSSKKRREEAKTGLVKKLASFFSIIRSLSYRFICWRRSSFVHLGRKESNIYYTLIPYCIEEIEHLAACVTNGQAAKIRCRVHPRCRVAGWIGSERISCFCRDQATLVGRENIAFLLPRLLCYLAAVGSRGEGHRITEQRVLADYEAREGFQDIEEYLVKDGSLCGYLFRMSHCQKIPDLGWCKIKSECVAMKIKEKTGRTRIIRSRLQRFVQILLGI